MTWPGAPTGYDMDRLNMLQYCRMKNESCNDFSHTLTTLGVCGAFNGLGPTAIFKQTSYISAFSEAFAPSQLSDHVHLYMTQGSGTPFKFSLLLDTHQSEVISL